MLHRKCSNDQNAVLEARRFRGVEFLVLQSSFRRIRKESEMMQHKNCKDLTINFHLGKVQAETHCLFKFSGREHGGS